MDKALYKKIASTLQAWKNCTENGNDWADRHFERLQEYCKQLPSGSGIDTGTALDTDKSTSERLVFEFSFHHMNDVGMYTDWTEHTVTVTPSLAFDFELTFTGEDRDQIFDYFYDIFDEALRSS